MSDVEALALLTPRQREVVTLFHRGHSTPEVAARMCTTINNVTVLANSARKRISRAAAPNPLTCPVGHLQLRPRGRCKACAKEARAADLQDRPASEAFRVDDTARSRIQADIAKGKRCRRCWLLSPCADHES